MLTFVVTHGLCHVHPRNYLFCETTPQWQCCRTAIYMDRCVLKDKQKPQKMSRIWRNVDTMKYSKEPFKYQFKQLFEKLNISNWAEGLTTRYKLGYILRNRWILKLDIFMSTYEGLLRVVTALSSTCHLHGQCEGTWSLPEETCWVSNLSGGSHKLVKYSQVSLGEEVVTSTVRNILPTREFFQQKHKESRRSSLSKIDIFLLF